MKQLRPLIKQALLPAFALFCLSALQRVQAAPYASSLTNDLGNISFILNESADSVTITCGATTVVVSNVASGTFTTNIGVAGTTYVAVSKVAGAGYKTPVGTAAANIATAGKIQLSTDPSLSRFLAPRGVGVNKNPASPYFGRIYVANSTAGTIAGRTVSRGFYTLNPDFSDSPNAYGDTAQTGGLTFSTASASTPYRISIGADNRVYIADYYDGDGDAYRVDENLQNGEAMFVTPGGNPGPNHGSVLKVIAEGSAANNDLVLYTIDEDYGATLNNDLWKYSIGNSTLPYSDLPTGVSSVLLGGFAINDDFCRGGSNNYFYVTQTRSSPATVPCLYILNSTGGTITDSRTLWRAFTGNASATDILTNLQSVAVSPDGKYLASVLAGAGLVGNSDTIIIPLTNGIPDMSRLMLLDTGTVNQGRGIEFDAAGNIYTISSGDGVLRAFSPGGTSTATTGTDGTFHITVPEINVTVTTSTTNVLEGSGTNGVFTISRSDTTGLLTVPYTLSGTASNGIDFTTLSGSVTFPDGVASTNIQVQVTSDSIAESTETVTLTVTAGASYTLGTPAVSTISILDDETPELSIVATQPTMLEPGSKAIMQVSRKGFLSSSVVVNLGYTGTAAIGSQFTGPATVTLASNAVTASFNLVPIDDLVFEPTQTAVVTVAAGTGYTISSNNVAQATLIDDDFAPAPSLFSDNFETDTTTSWTLNSSDALTDTHADFNYDYSLDGVPSAPHSGGTTRGLKFRANESSKVVVGLTASPVGQTFSGNYRLRFDAWMNFVGPLATGGAGSTHALLMGVGTTGDHPIWQGALGSLADDGPWFFATGDGGNAAATGDYNAYIGSILQTDASGVYAAGTNGPRDSAHAFYTAWGRQPAPAGQLSNTNQTGVTSPGVLGMAWHTVAVTKQDDIVTWSIDGRTLTTVTNTIPDGKNIFVGYTDPFLSVPNAPELVFGVIDNVTVDNLSVPSAPTISSIQLINNKTEVQINFAGAASDTAAAFTLVGSSTLSTSGAAYTAVPGANVSGSAGSFQATAPVSNGTMFYLIRR